MHTIPTDVIKAAKASMLATKVPASVSIAQWAWESGWGAHAPGNNPFGIKHMKGYADQQFLTHEVVRGRRITVVQTFAKFDTLDQAFTAHAQLISTRPQYAAAMRCLPDVTAFVAKLGPVYATDPTYATKIMAVIRQNNLTQYDNA